MALTEEAIGLFSILSIIIVMFVLIALTYTRNILENWFGWFFIIPIISILLGMVYFVKIDDFEHPNLYAIKTILGLGMLVGGILAFIINSLVYFAVVARRNTRAIRSIS